MKDCNLLLLSVEYHRILLQSLYIFIENFTKMGEGRIETELKMPLVRHCFCKMTKMCANLAETLNKTFWSKI